MQKFILKLCPLICFLLILSCTKENDLIPQEEPIATQALGAGGGGEGPCNVACKQPDFVQVSNVTGCGAEINWGFEGDYCGTFMVHLQNMTTGIWTIYDPATSPLTLWSLEPCTEYTVGISHITEICASVPLEVTFKTSCESCECRINCKTPDYAYVDNVGETRAIIKFGFNEVGETCGKFIAMLKNNDTGITTYMDPALSPLELSGLTACTSYTISLSHVTDLQACVPTDLHFDTPCDDGPCEAKGLNAEEAILDEIYFDQGPTGTVTYLEAIGSTDGYINFTSPIVTLQPNIPMGLAFCFTLLGAYTTSDVEIKMWIDFDGDNHFELNEVILDYSHPSIGSLCVGLLPALTFPTQEICGVRGRAIFSVNNGEILSPCEDVPIGNVIDFLVNVGDCEAHN